MIDISANGMFRFGGPSTFMQSFASVLSDLYGNVTIVTNDYSEMHTLDHIKKRPIKSNS